MDFDLHKLGWYGFQQLCHSLTGESLGQTVEAFLPGHDGGRDGAFTGSWRTGSDDLSGRFVVQCKHSVIPGSNLVLSDMTDDFEKAERLHRNGLCDAYLIMTNQGISGALNETIVEDLASRGITQVRTFGRDWINRMLTENKRLRMLVPRVYGLGDLTQILDERAYRQAVAVLEGMRGDLAKVVRTKTYEDASAALEAHRFVMLLGRPATGKSTVAAQLALAAIDVNGASVIKLDSIDDFADKWNVDEPQLFWLDDAFGATQFEVDFAHAWARLIPKVHAALARGSQMIVTSRDYIFQSARPNLKIGSFPLLNESQITVDVRRLTQSEKQQILYNHLKHGTQPPTFIASIRPFLDELVQHRGFTPELARRLSHPLFTKRLHSISSETLEDFFSRPVEFLSETLTELDADMQAALGLIYSHRGHLQAPVEYSDTDKDLLDRLGSNVGGVTRALRSMDGSLVRLSRDAPSGWQYAHPTMTEAYEGLLRAHPELLHHYVLQADRNGLLRTITCGDVGITGSLVVGENLFDIVVARLDEPPEIATESYRDRYAVLNDRRSMIYGFLVSRANKDFLALYISSHEEVLERIARPGLMLDAVVEVRLAKRLFEFGILPEASRKAFIAQISDYMVDGEDAAALYDEDLRSMLTGEEMESLLERIKSELIPSLSDVIEGVTSNYESEQGAPGEYVGAARRILGVLIDEFPDDEALVLLCEEQDQLLDDWVEETPWQDYDGSEGWSDYRRSSPVTHVGDRSIFDDLV